MIAPPVVSSLTVPPFRTGTNPTESKRAAGRDKDQLFLATHLDALQQLLKKPDLE